MKPRHLTALILAAMVAKSAGTTYTWTGGADNTWANSANWNTTIPTASDIAQWDTPSIANLGITLGTTPQSVAGLKVLSPSGAVSVSGSTLTLGTSGIDMSSATQNLTISSNLTTAAGSQVWNVASGQTLALNTGTFTRANNATLNLQGTGTVTTTMTGLANAGSTNIIGAWATVGTGANTRYATRDASNNLVAYTGTAATNSIPTGTSGTGNYDLSGTTTTGYGTFRDFNTVRYTDAGITQTFNTGMNVRGGFLNAGAGTLTLNGSGSINMASGELVLHAANANIDILTPLTGAGAKLTIVGPKTVTSGGANTYSGVTTVNSGTLQFTKTQAFYSNTIDAANAAKLTVNSGATAAFNMGAASGEFTEGNISTLLAASNGSVGFKGGSSLGLDTTNAVGGSYTYVSAIVNPNGNSIGLTKLGTGTLVLSAGNTYTGGTTITGGTLNFANGYIDTTSNITMNGGALQWATGNTQDISSKIVMNTGKTATFDTNGNNVTFATAIGNSTTGALTKAGNGTLTLSGTNTYTGGTSVTGGTLSFANGALGTTGGISMNGGALQWNGTNTQDVSSRIVMNAGKTATFDTNGNDVTFATGIGSSTNGSLVKSGNGTLTLSGTNNYSGQTTVSGGTLSITGTKTSGGNVIVNGTASTPAILNLQNSNALGTGTVSATNTNSGVQLQGDITLPGSVSFLISNSGGTVPYAIGNVSGNNTINGPIQMTVGGGSPVIQSDSGSLTLAGNISIAYVSDGNRTLTLQGASTGANTVSGVVSNLSGGGVASITKNGAGTWTISGANTYTGGTAINAGTLIANNAGTPGTSSALGKDSAVTLANAAATNLQLNANLRIGSLAGGGTTGGNVNLQGNALTVGANDTSTGYSGVISGDEGALTKMGTGTLTLSGANTYSGKTTISGGSLTLGVGGSIDNTSEIALNGGNFNVSTVGGYTVDSGESLTGSGSVTGNVTVNGTLAIGNSPGTITFNDGLTLGGSSISNFQIESAALGLGTYDLAQGGTGSQTVNFDGILNLFFTNSETFLNDSTVKIFDFENYAGNFDQVNISGLGAGQTATFDALTGVVTVVPEPGAALLGSLGVLALLRRRRL